MKETIRERYFLDGKQNHEWPGKRTVYRNKDGNPFIRDHQGKKFLLIDPDGTLVLEQRVTTLNGPKDLTQLMNKIAKNA